MSDVEDMTLREYAAQFVGCGVEDVVGACLEGGRIRSTFAWGRVMMMDMPPAPVVEEDPITETAPAPVSVVAEVEPVEVPKPAKGKGK